MTMIENARVGKFGDTFGISLSDACSEQEKENLDPSIMAGLTCVAAVTSL